MKIKRIEYNENLITRQMHATFEREGWAIFNTNVVEKIDSPEEWREDFNPPIISSDKVAKHLAEKHGFVFEDKDNPYLITHIVIRN